MSQNRNLSIHADYINSSGVLTPAGGGLGVSATPANGQIPIGNGTNYVPATLTAGTGVTVTNAAGSVTITNTNPTPTGLGINQTWHDVTSSRATGTVYTNSGTLPIAVNIILIIPAANFTTCYINGSQFGVYGNNGSGSTYVTPFIIVPPGATYNFTGGVSTLVKWWELY
jgi:hypothetical protein